MMSRCMSIGGVRVVSRVGVDIDTHDGLTLLYCFLRASNIGHAVCYYTRHGFHVQCDLESPVTFQEALHIRRWLNDCPDRLAVDEHRVNSGADLRRFDTLFVGRLKGGVCYTRREIKPLACGPWSEASVDGVRVENGAVGGSQACDSSGECVA